MLFLLHYIITQTLTDEAEDVLDGRDKDDQSVGASQQDHCDDGVTDPAEVLRGAQELVDRGTNLHTDTQTGVILHESQEKKTQLKR